MNYFTHGLLHLHSPYFLAGTHTPDWLSVADRKVRLRPRHLEPWLGHPSIEQRELAAGTLRHLEDDDWFHSTRGFAEVVGELAGDFRSLLGPDQEHHCGFLGHVAMELLLDGILIEKYPSAFDEYWQVLAAIDPHVVQAGINLMATRPTERLAVFIDIYRREQFLRSYTDDASLLARLNNVLDRVRLKRIPNDAVTVIHRGRELVRRCVLDLLPPERLRLP